MDDIIKKEVEVQVTSLLTKKFHEILSPQVQEQFNALYQHLMNANVALSDLARAREFLSAPININDGHLTWNLNRMSEEIFRLKNILNDLIESRKEFQKYFEDENVLKKLSAFDTTLGEIKYIGKRLKKIEDEITCIKNDGVKRKVSVHVFTDGFSTETEKDEDDPDYEKVNMEVAFVKCLTKRQLFVLKHRCGLFGETSKTFSEISTLEGVSIDRVRQVYIKALRALRRKSEFSKNSLPEGRLKSVIFNEDSQT